MAKTLDKVLKSNIETVYEASRKAIADLGYSILNSNKEDFTISFNTGRSMSSWHGQDLSVTLFREGSETKAVVGGSIAKGGSALTGGGSQVFSWGEKDKLSRKFLDTVEKLLPNFPVVQAVAATNTVASGSLADELQKLLSLKEAGVLSDDEFATAKAKLIGG